MWFWEKEWSVMAMDRKDSRQEHVNLDLEDDDVHSPERHAPLSLRLHLPGRRSHGSPHLLLPFLEP